MNHFEYKVNLAKIQTASLVKDLEPLVRNYYQLAHDKFGYSPYNITKKVFEEGVYEFKLLSYSYNKFKSVSTRKLPDFIINYIYNLEEGITRLISKSDNEVNYYIDINYDEFIDLFEYSKDIRCYNNAGQFIQKLAEIVGSKPQPYSFLYNYQPNSYYYEVSGRNTVVSRVLLLEHFKQQIAQSDNTVIEEELAILYRDIADTEDNLDKQQILHAELTQVIQTSQTKLKEAHDTRTMEKQKENKKD